MVRVAAVAIVGTVSPVWLQGFRQVIGAVGTAVRHEHLRACNVSQRALKRSGRVSVLTGLLGYPTKESRLGGLAKGRSTKSIEGGGHTPTGYPYRFTLNTFGPAVH
jgi:hypothetical protein